MFFDEELTEDLDAREEDCDEESEADSEEQEADYSLPVTRCTIDPEQVRIARQEATARRLNALLSADPCEAPDELHSDYLRQIRRTTHCGYIDSYRFRMNCQVRSSYRRDAPVLATLARLIKEGILTTTDGEHFTIERAALPVDSRDLYQTALDYLAHSHTARILDRHSLLYKADIFEPAAQEAILAKLQQERYIDGAGTVLRRPEGATVETYYYESSHADASVIVRRDHQGYSALFSCCVTTKESEGYGLYATAYPPEHDYSDDEPVRAWPDRNSAFQAAVHAVCRQAESTIVEAAFHPQWRSDTTARARSIRAWAEMINRTPIAPQLELGFQEKRARFLASLGASADTSAKCDVIQGSLF